MTNGSHPKVKRPATGSKKPTKGRPPAKGTTKPTQR